MIFHDISTFDVRFLSGNYENKLERLTLEIIQIQAAKWTEGVPGRGLVGRNGRDEDLG